MGQSRINDRPTVPNMINTAAAAASRTAVKRYPPLDQSNVSKASKSHESQGIATYMPSLWINLHQIRSPLSLKTGELLILTSCPSAVKDPIVFPLELATLKPAPLRLVLFPGIRPDASVACELVRVDEVGATVACESR